MEEPDAFLSSAWGVQPTEEWNRLEHWRERYRDLRDDVDSSGRGAWVHRDVHDLIEMLLDAGELPCALPQTILDAGCGIALVPNILAYWGFTVTAIDLSPRAIEVAARQRPEEMARCVTVWDPVYNEHGKLVAHDQMEDPERSLQRLRSFQATGGAVAHIAGDWFTANLPVSTFGLIYCRNALRCSLKPYWRRSLNRFRELLTGGGLLLLEHVNVFGIYEEVRQMLGECGFVALEKGRLRDPALRYVRDIWPTG